MKLSSLTTQDKIKLAAELDGWTFDKSKHGHWLIHDPDKVLHEPGFNSGWCKFDSQTGKPNGEMPATYNCSGLIPDYSTSYDAIIPLIQKQDDSVKDSFMKSCVGGISCYTPSQLLDALLIATGKCEDDRSNECGHYEFELTVEKEIA